MTNQIAKEFGLDSSLFNSLFLVALIEEQKYIVEMVHASQTNIPFRLLVKSQKGQVYSKP